MNFGYKFLFVAIFVSCSLGVIMSLVTSYFYFGMMGMFAMAGIFSAIVIIGGVMVYKKRDVSIFGRVMRNEPIE